MLAKVKQLLKQTARQTGKRVDWDKTQEENRDKTLTETGE